MADHACHSIVRNSESSPPLQMSERFLSGGDEIRSSYAYNNHSAHYLNK